MIKTLLIRNGKTLYKPWLIFSAIISMYIIIIIEMFDPSLGESLNLMMESMPELFSAFGMNAPGSTLLDFIANYLYGFLLICLPMILELIAVNLLMVRYIDRGSMAWLLSSPNSRTRIAATQAISLAASTVLQVIYIVAISMVSAQLGFPGELDVPQFLVLNLGLLGLHLFLSGVCFLGGCIFSEGRYALGFGGGLCILFVLLQMLSQVGEDWDFLRYITPLTLFDAKAIAAGEAEFLPLAALYLGALVLYSLGIVVFSKKDLSL